MMDIASRAPVFAVAIILSGAVISGPLVGAIDFTQYDSTPSTEGLGTGNVTVENVSLPATGTLRKGNFGSGSYYLEIPMGELGLSEKTGRPVIAYEIELTLGNISYNQESVYFVGPDTGNRIGLSFNRETFPPHEITEDQYTGRLIVRQRANDTERIIATQNITIEVDG